MIFFSDMDGTLLATDKSVSAATWAALDAVHAAGIQFVPCTARAFNGVPAELLAHPSVRYVVASNGASVVDLETETQLHAVHLSRERVQQVWETARDFDDITFDVFSDGACYAQRERYNRLDEFAGVLSTLESLQANRTPYDESTDEFIAAHDNYERITMYWKHEEDAAKIRAALAQDPTLAIVRSAPNNIEVSDITATKGGALTWLCGYLGEDVADAVSFGDNINDISMIEAAGCGVAMKNAEPENLAAADLIADTNDNDGVAKVIMAKLGA